MKLILYLYKKIYFFILSIKLKTLKQTLHLNKNQYKILRDYAHYSNNLYNYGLYIIRQYYFETGKYLGYNKLEKEVKLNENYRLLPVQSAQQILRLLDKNFRSFFALLRKKNLGQYTDKINIPKYKNKGGMFNIIFTFQNFTFRENKNILTFHQSKEYKKLNSNKLFIDFNYKIDGKIKQILFKPANNGQYFKMYIQYEENRKENNYELNKNNYLSIDLGINNLASCFNGQTGHSLLMNGKPLKSYNRYYNKQMSKIKSELKLKNKKDWSNRLQRFTNNRENYIDNYFNQIVNKIIKYCIQNNIGNIILGYNENWKKNINIGKVNNQKFMNIPYLQFKIKLENKCNENGMIFQYIEESYTSKCSFLDNEEMIKKDNYLGKRIKRGLFKSQFGKLLNADINGAANILRKNVIGDIRNNQPILGLMFNPIKINIF